MTKKIFALVMVLGIFGAFVGGCAPKEEGSADTAGATAGATTGAAATTTADATK
jgi:hypothetical protein